MKRGEIWLVSLDPASAHEQKGRRPVLIASPEAFNRITKLPVILPITSGGSFVRTAGFRRAADRRRNQNDGCCPVRPAPSSGYCRARRQEAGKHFRRDHGRSAGEDIANI